MTQIPRSSDVAIAGLGMTELGKVYGPTATQFAADAVQRALRDAGLERADLDGLLINSSPSSGLGLGLQTELGLRDLRLLSHVQSYGASVGVMIQYAALSLAAGLVDYVALVYADAPLTRGGASADPYGRARRPVEPGMAGLNRVYGDVSVNIGYAMAARRHMALYQTTSEQLGAVAVAARGWARMNPVAQQRGEMTIADHQASRWIAEPLHLFDCCLVSNGAVAVILTTSDRAQALRQPPVRVLAVAQAHPGANDRAERDPFVTTGAARSGPRALELADLELRDIDLCEIYDCYTYTTLVTLEDYGFCAKGEGGAFVEDGRLGPRGSLPVNTGGGQLSGYYMWGMTPLSEAVIQVRGHGGERQVDRHDIALVSGNGGLLGHHSTMILGAQR